MRLSLLSDTFTTPPLFTNKLKGDLDSFLNIFNYNYNNIIY